MFGKKGNRPEPRFTVKYKEAFCGGEIWIVVDSQTGVNYIATVGLGTTSFSPLLDENGKVVIDK